MQTKKNYFEERIASPRIYAYSDIHYPGCIKIGYTSRTAEERVREQQGVVKPGERSYTILMDEPAVRPDGSCFSDHQVHKMLDELGVPHEGGEWYRATIEQVRNAYLSVFRQEKIESTRSWSFGMRPEQVAAVEQTAAYYNSWEETDPGLRPKYLWNAKMRFGKTFTTYQLAKKMGFKRVLVLTYKPAVEKAWEEDLKNHVDFEGWHFLNKDNLKDAWNIRESERVVAFVSYQDLLGKDKKNGTIKEHHEWLLEQYWDLLVVDEYHFGAWRDTAKDLYTGEEDKKFRSQEYNEEVEQYAEAKNLQFKVKRELYLSGTPFRAINEGEFTETCIFNWTYADEQKAKAEWDITKGPNPYAELPRMVLLTLKLPEEMTKVAEQTEFDSFSLNTFFAATGGNKGQRNQAKFTNETEVQKWLDIIRGYQATSDAIADDLKKKADRVSTKPIMPFDDVSMLHNLTHTFWYLPNVAACYAMRDLLSRPANKFYHDYQVIVAAGEEAGVGKDAVEPVDKALGKDPLLTKTITLSCGKLTTGVSIKPWTGILMLRDTTSPESYFQAAFRVQTPWIIKGDSPSEDHILKENCYVYDFAPNRALRLVQEYANKLNVNENDTIKKISEVIDFLPILAYDGQTMKEINAEELMEFVAMGTTSSLLARSWESDMLINVDDITLNRVLNDPKALEIIMKIEGFRKLGSDIIETIVNQSKSIKDKKKELLQNGTDTDEAKSTKKELTQEEKEYKSKRAEVKEKLKKFATRIPVFMYMSDYREVCLHDVITKLEPGLFTKVTGLTQADFGLLTELGVFDKRMMDNAVILFKKTEEYSLDYTSTRTTSLPEGAGFYPLP